MRVNYNIGFLFLSCLSLLTGCSRKNESLVYNTYVDDDVVDGYNVVTDYDFSKSEKDGFVIIKSGEVINENKIDEFYNKTTNNEDAILTIVRYTDEEEEIVVQYVYKDETYTVYIDSTRLKNEKGKVLSRIIKDIEIGYDDNGHKIIIEKY